MDTNTYKRIEAFAIFKMSNSKDKAHNDDHVLQVKDNALKIVKLLGLDKQVDKDILKTACLLHDFSYTLRKSNIYTYFFEGHIERRAIRQVLDNYDLPDATKEIIIEAAFHHTHSFPFKKLNKEGSVYTKILQDADTLDFFGCLRIKMYIDGHSKGLLGGVRKFISNKLIDYGMTNLKNFLNYPELVKSFYTDSSMKCIV